MAGRGYKVDQRVERLIDNWSKRNITGIYCDTKELAADKLAAMIPVSGSVGFSGSLTLDRLQVVKRLQDRGNKLFNQYQIGISRQESLDLRKQSTMADYYLASANAIAETGELVFLSAYGNRSAGIANATNVILVCGTNKIVPNLNAALKRAREYATPRNCERLNWNSACLKDGICRSADCLFPEYKRMCCQVLIIEAEVVEGRLKVILVPENLGF